MKKIAHVIIATLLVISFDAFTQENSATQNKYLPMDDAAAAGLLGATQEQLEFDVLGFVPVDSVCYQLLLDQAAGNKTDASISHLLLTEDDVEPGTTLGNVADEGSGFWFEPGKFAFDGAGSVAESLGASPFVLLFKVVHDPVGAAAAMTVNLDHTIGCAVTGTLESTIGSVQSGLQEHDSAQLGAGVSGMVATLFYYRGAASLKAPINQALGRAGVAVGENLQNIATNFGSLVRQGSGELAVQPAFVFTGAIPIRAAGQLGAIGAAGAIAGLGNVVHIEPYVGDWQRHRVSGGGTATEPKPAAPAPKDLVTSDGYFAPKSTTTTHRYYEWPVNGEVTPVPADRAAPPVKANSVRLVPKGILSEQIFRIGETVTFEKNGLVRGLRSKGTVRDITIHNDGTCVIEYEVLKQADGAFGTWRPVEGRIAQRTYVLRSYNIEVKAYRPHI